MDAEFRVPMKDVLKTMVKTVPKNGQISGFTDLAGQTVKIMVLRADPEPTPPAKGKKGA